MAAAQRMRSSYCALAHGVGLMKHFYDVDTVLHLASDRENVGLDEVDLAVMRFAEKVVDDASQITQADVDRLRDLGLDDDDVLDVALAAAARCFFSKPLDAVGAQPDSAYLRLDEKLRDVLTVGRPIAAVADGLSRRRRLARGRRCLSRLCIVGDGDAGTRSDDPASCTCRTRPSRSAWRATRTASLDFVAGARVSIGHTSRGVLWRGDGHRARSAPPGRGPHADPRVGLRRLARIAAARRR